jgi:hypothetical protein
VRHLALVEAVAPLLLENAECFGEVGIAIDLPGNRLLSVDVPRGNGIRVDLRATLLGLEGTGGSPLGKRQSLAIRSETGNPCSA